MGVGHLFGGAAGGAAEIPAYSYSGDHLVRLQLYNGVLYAEWELRSSGMLTFDQPRTLDAMLVGGGGVMNRGSELSGWTGAGGSAYYTVAKDLAGVTAAQVLVAAGGGDTTLTIGTSSYTAQKGGAAYSTAGGVGYNGPYRLFDEPGEQYVRGAGSNGGNGATSGGSYTNPPAVGNGLRLINLPTGGSVLAGLTTPSQGTVSKDFPAYGGVGYGGGQSALYLGGEYTSDNNRILFGTRGNPGVVLVRVKLS